MFSRCFIHLLKDSIIVGLYSVLIVHICMGKYKDTLMIVIGCNGNNQLFTLVFAITKSENINSWG